MRRPFSALLSVVIWQTDCRSPTSPNNWTITLSQGWTLNVPIGTVEIDEPEGGLGPNGFFLENFIAFADETTILWASENETDIRDLPLSQVLPDLLISPSGERFDVLVADLPELQHRWLSNSARKLLGIPLN
jgi:hypothetical protein